MKTIIALLLSLIATSSAKDRIGFEWDPSPPAEWVNGYRIYQMADTIPPLAPTWKITGRGWNGLWWRTMEGIVSFTVEDFRGFRSVEVIV